MPSPADFTSLVRAAGYAVRRAASLRVPGHPGAYYASALVRDASSLTVWASGGALFREREERSRDCFFDVRVGSYRYDQVSDGGLDDNDEEAPSASYVSLPIDDHDGSATDVALWKLSELRFREALEDYADRRAGRVSKLDPTERFPSFRRLPPTRHVARRAAAPIDRERWTDFCVRTSRAVSRYRDVQSSWVDLDASRETRIFVNSEDRVVVQHADVLTLGGTLRARTRDGAFVEQTYTVTAGGEDELPDEATFLEETEKRRARLALLATARRIHSFSGPVLLKPVPAGLLVHEAIGHRLEGSRLLARGEGRTFMDAEGEQVLPFPLTVVDDPRLSRFGGRRCVGSYDFDDEGTEAAEAQLLSRGKLAGFLTTRASIGPGKSRPNGHARNRRHQRPMSRMAVTVVSAEEGRSEEELKELLVAEAARQKKPYGMIVYETSGGETGTTSYDFQAFSGQVAYATLVDRRGVEEVVRGVNFVGTPLQALHHVIAAGRERVLDNGFCGAESGFVPVSTISPSLLLGNLELQAKDEDLVPPFLLPPPPRRRVK